MPPAGLAVAGRPADSGGRGATLAAARGDSRLQHSTADGGETDGGVLRTRIHAASGESTFPGIRSVKAPVPFFEDWDTIPQHVRNIVLPAEGAEAEGPVAEEAGEPRHAAMVRHLLRTSSEPTTPAATGLRVRGRVAGGLTGTDQLGTPAPVGLLLPQPPDCPA